jgi:dTDP-4-amino-4,6-dideoxygalactose transaminase
MQQATTPSSGGDSDVSVPFVDLEPVTRPLSAAILADFDRVMGHGAFINGQAVRVFEEAFASWSGRSHCIGVASGLDALRLGLLALDIGPGDEVIVPAMTFVATFEAVAQVGATPVPVDVRADDCGLDADAVEAAVTPRTRAILPVHLYGQMVDVHRLEKVAGRYGLLVLEDACQAHGAERDGHRAGGWGRAAAFSFYPSKNLGAMGDAGALVTDDTELAARVRALREHGQTSRYRSGYVGYTARLDTLQAVVLSHKLPLLENWNEQRREAAAAYAEALSGVGDLRLPESVSGSIHVWHIYAVRTRDPERLAEHLRRCGIATGRHYPEPPHLSAAFASLGYGAGAFPNSEEIAAETLSLPLYPGITQAQIDAVAAAVKGFFERD